MALIISIIKILINGFPSSILILRSSDLSISRSLRRLDSTVGSPNERSISREGLPIKLPMIRDHGTAGAVIETNPPRLHSISLFADTFVQLGARIQRCPNYSIRPRVLLFLAPPFRIGESCQCENGALGRERKTVRATSRKG